MILPYTHQALSYHGCHVRYKDTLTFSPEIFHLDFLRIKIPLGQFELFYFIRTHITKSSPITSGKIFRIKVDIFILFLITVRTRSTDGEDS